MVDDSQAKTAAHAVLAAVLQVRAGRLQALLWQRAREPFAACWALPGGALAADETLEESMRRHLAEKVDVREVAHLEQLETLSDPARNPIRRELATAFLGLVPSGVDPQVPEDTRWHPLDELPELAYDHEEILLSARERLRGKLSYTNLGFALAPPSFTLAELRDLYAAALGHPVERDEPPARPAAAPAARGHGRAAALRRRRRPAGGDLPLPHERAGDHRPVRRPPAAYNGPLSGRAHPDPLAAAAAQRPRVARLPVRPRSRPPSSRWPSS